MSTAEVAGIVAGILGFIETPRYIYSIVMKKTVPHSLTWVAMAIFSTTFFVTYESVGAGYTVWVPLGDALGYILILPFALYYGTRKSFRGVDLASFSGAVVSVGVFYLTKQGWLLGVAIVLSMIPTVMKTIEKPSEEDVWSWSITVVANTLNFFAITEDIESVYVIVTFAVDAWILVLILRQYK